MNSVISYQLSVMSLMFKFFGKKLESLLVPRTQLSVISVQLLLITGLLFISSCGFHLRGAAGYNLSLVYIQSESADRVANEVKRRLTEGGVQVVPTTSAAQAVVYLRHETIDRRVLTVSSVSGKQEEFELNYRVELEVRKPDDTVLLEKQTLSLLRDYLFDETAVLAMGAEEEVLREDMFRDIVAQIMRRLQVLQLGKRELSQLAFEGLKPKYSVGEQMVVNLVEKNTRKTPVDIWLSISIGKNLWFVTPTENESQAWQLSQEPQAWQRNVAPTQTRHRVLDFTVPAKAGGKYTLRAVYTKAGAGLELSNLAPSLRSNIVESSTVFENQ